MDKSLAICNISGQFSVIIDNRIDCTDDLRRRGKFIHILCCLYLVRHRHIAPAHIECFHRRDRIFYLIFFYIKCHIGIIKTKFFKTVVIHCR